MSGDWLFSYDVSVKDGIVGSYTFFFGSTIFFDDGIVLVGPNDVSTFFLSLNIY